MPKRFRLWVMMAFTAVCALGIWYVAMVQRVAQQQRLTAQMRAQQNAQRLAALQQAALGSRSSRQRIALKEKLLRVGSHYLDPKRIIRATEREDGTVVVELEGSRESLHMEGDDATALRRWLRSNSVSIDAESPDAELAVGGPGS